MNEDISLTQINGHVAKFHSEYRAWSIYRCYDGGNPRMLYFGVGGGTVLESRNLDGIKAKIKEAVLNE